MQFKTRPVHILKKPDPSNELPEEFEDMFAQQIETLQNHALSTSEEVNRWFVTCIMLPTLLGLDPLEDTCGPFLPSDRPDTMWILSAQRFFPQWARWQRDERLLEKLKNFLRHDIFRLTAAQRRALNSVRHILKRAVRSGLNPATLAEAEKVVYQVGQPGWSLLQRIIEARQSRSLEQVQIAISLCELIGQSAQSQLWDLCQEFRTKYNSPESEYQCDDFVMRKPASDPGNAAKQEADPPLPFDIEFLRRACEALIDNAKKHFTDQEKHMRISLQVQDSHDHVAITYRDNSQGFPSLDALSKAVNDSMERNKAGAGLNRGLPLVLAFGLHFPLNSLQIKYNDGCWFQLYPERREIDAEAEKGFGVRWCFMYPGRSAMRSEIE